jgi:hypothetical protein
MSDERKSKVKLKKIHKTSSHQAFTTKKAAFENFKYRKRKHKTHLERTLTFVDKFLDEVDKCEGEYETFVERNTNNLLVKTSALVGEFLHFD